MHRTLGSFTALALLAASIIPVSAFAESLVGLTQSGTSLVFFDSAAPDATGTVHDLGLPAGEGFELLAIDTRADGSVFGLGNDAKVYAVDLQSFALTEANATPVAGTLGDHVGFDFNPSSGQLRVSTVDGKNLRYDLADGTTVEDTDFAYGGLAALRLGQNIRLTGLGYRGGETPALFGIDYAHNELVSIGGTAPDLHVVEPIPNPLPLSGGGSLLVGEDDVDPEIGFDVSAEGIAYLTAQADGVTSGLYTVNLTTGLATRVGALGVALRDLTVHALPTDGDGGAGDGGTGDGGIDDGGIDDGGASSSGGSSSGGSSSGGTSSGGSSSGGSSSGGTSSGGMSSGASGTSGNTGDFGSDGLEGGGCAAAPSRGDGWSIAALAAGVGLLISRLRRRR